MDVNKHASLLFDMDNNLMSSAVFASSLNLDETTAIEDDCRVDASR